MQAEDSCMEIKNLEARLQTLAVESALLDIPQSERQMLTDQTVAYAHQFIAGLARVQGFTEKEPGDLTISDTPKTLPELLQSYQQNVAETGINAAAGTHMGYIPGGGVYTAALADFIAAITNPYAGVYYASPGAATIEKECIRWLKNVFSFPESATGVLSSGGSISTLIAFTAARDRHGVKNERVRKSVVYLSEQVHHAAQKALRIIGLEDVIIRYVPLDEGFRLRSDALSELVAADKAAGLNPFLLVATAGTTDTGAMDPLDALADIAERQGLWFHVDGAYGGFFILTSKRPLFKGIERADSLIVDPHKSLFLPYGLGAVLVKDPGAVLQTQHYEANYMQDAVEESLTQSPANLSPELTRHFRGLRMWLPLQLHGLKPFVACLEEKLLLTQYFRIRLQATGCLVGAEPDLAVSYFWYPFGQNEDTANSRLMDEIHRDGDVFLSSSIIGGRFVIRIAILAFRTKKETIDRAIAMIERCIARVEVDKL